jgi:gluconolactonase
MWHRDVLSRRHLLQLAAGGLALTSARRALAQTRGRVIQPQQATAPELPGPYPRIEKFDPGLDAVLTGETPQILATGLGPGLEGPMWWKEGGYLLFCQGGAARRMKYKPGEGVSVATENVRNGALTRDMQGRMLVTEGASRRVAREEADGSVTVIADKYMGTPLNSPNDLVVKSDGSIYFTDPTFMPKELGYNGVYRVSPDLKTIDLLADNLDFPNGIALSPDEKILYIADGVNLAIKAFNILPNGLVDKQSLRVAADVRGNGAPGRPDGFKVDSAGNFHTNFPSTWRSAATTGRRCSSSRARRLGR